MLTLIAVALGFILGINFAWWRSIRVPRYRPGGAVPVSVLTDVLHTRSDEDEA